MWSSWALASARASGNRAPADRQLRRHDRDHRATDLDPARQLGASRIFERDMNDALPSHLGPLLADDRDLGSSRDQAVPDRHGYQRSARRAGGRVFRDARRAMDPEHTAVQPVGSHYREEEDGWRSVRTQDERQG